MKNIEEQREREKVDLGETLFPLNSNCGSGYKSFKGKLPQYTIQ